MFARGLRGLVYLGMVIAHRWRVVILCAKYPGLRITPGAHIDPGCEITCSIGSKLEIEDCHVSRGCTIRADHGAVVHIAASFIGPNSVIVGRDQICIEAGVELAEMVVIRDQDHVSPLEAKAFVTSPIEIERNAWVGAKATILRGSRIGRESVIASHSVVKGNVESGSLYAGAPAQRVR